jgi:hypothetical protein
MISWDRFSRADPTLPRYGTDLTTRESRISKNRAIFTPSWVSRTSGDCHLYSNHLMQARSQLERQPRALPRLWVNPEVREIFAFRFEDFRIDGYEPYPHISAPVAV